MRVAIVTESFLPSLNGVTTSVCKVLEGLRRRGHEALVIAPKSPRTPGTNRAVGPSPDRYAGFEVRTVTSVPVRQFRVGLPPADLEDVIERFAPDVLHAASPFVLGVGALSAARYLEVPSIAVYQTDMPSYIRQHSGHPVLGDLTSRAAWRWVRHIHRHAGLTLAPSAAAMADLRAHRVPRVRLWGRGVDADLFHPQRRGTAAVRALRARLAPGGETIIGYVGRLAPEKELHRLAELSDLPGVRLVLVGDGPSRTALRSTLPGAAFLGQLQGEDLADAYAGFDIFVHTGTTETFGQTLQEAAAAGLPVIAPRRGGPIDLVEDEVTGLLFDPDTHGALRAAVVRMLPDAGAGPPGTSGTLLAQEFRERCGVSGRTRVRSRSWDGLVDQLIGHYAEAVSLTSRSREVA